MVTNSIRGGVHALTGVRMTRQRQVILEEVRRAAGHPAADEIFVRVRRRLRRISLATVYRNLEVLAAWGMIRKADLGGSQRRYEPPAGEHCHVRCIRCGRVADVAVRLRSGLEEACRELSGYEIIGKRIEFIGLCRRCAPARHTGDGPARQKDGGEAPPDSRPASRRRG